MNKLVEVLKRWLDQPIAIVKAFAVIDMKAGGLFLMEGAGGPHIAFGLIGFAIIPHDLATDHLGQRNTIAQLVKESRGQAHCASIIGLWREVQSARRRVCG